MNIPKHVRWIMFKKTGKTETLGIVDNKDKNKKEPDKKPDKDNRKQDQKK